MEVFDKQKKEYMDALYKPDRSKKGNVDEPIKQLLDTINDHPDYYTTSSCSGRIMIFCDNNEKVKAKASWLYVSHDQSELQPILESLKELPNAPVWFRLEGMILHVCARNLAEANKFLTLAQNNGYKHTGVLSMNKRFIVQVMGVDRFDSLIAQEGELMVNEAYLTSVLEIANKKLEETHKKIEKLELAFKEFSVEAVENKDLPYHERQLSD